MSDPNVSVRFFIFEADGTLRRVSHQSTSRLVHGGGAVPQFVGQKIRYLEVIVEIEGKVPFRIVNMCTGYLHVDAKGSIDRALRESAVRYLPPSRDLRGLDPDEFVIAFPPAHASEKNLSDSVWAPSKQELAQIAGAIWPEKRPAGMPRPNFLKITAVAPD